MRTKTTIQDVARHAGVSKVTVSYVLNGLSASARISGSTETKVLESARLLNYTPNAVARTLATRRSQTLAVVLQSGTFFSRDSSFTAELMRGVCAASVSAGYDLMLHTSPVENPLEEANRLSDGRVDGALVLRDEGDAMLETLLKSGFPCVQFFTRSKDSEACFVDADNFRGAQLAAEHFLQLGHTRFLMVRGPNKSVSATDRYNGFSAALEGRGVLKFETITIGDPQDSLEEFSNIVSQADRATAIFVWSDDVAFQCMKELQRLGLSIPADVSIVGFDSCPSSERSDPPLTSVYQPVFEMAEEATSMLTSLIKGEELRRRQGLYPLDLRVRASTRSLL